MHVSLHAMLCWGLRDSNGSSITCTATVVCRGTYLMMLIPVPNPHKCARTGSCTSHCTRTCPRVLSLSVSHRFACHVVGVRSFAEKTVSLIARLEGGIEVLVGALSTHGCDDHTVCTLALRLLHTYCKSNGKRYSLCFAVSLVSPRIAF